MIRRIQRWDPSIRQSILPTMKNERWSPRLHEEEDFGCMLHAEGLKEPIGFDPMKSDETKKTTKNRTRRIRIRPTMTHSAFGSFLFHNRRESMPNMAIAYLLLQSILPSTKNEEPVRWFRSHDDRWNWWRRTTDSRTTLREEGDEEEETIIDTRTDDWYKYFRHYTNFRCYKSFKPNRPRNFLALLSLVVAYLTTCLRRQTFLLLPQLFNRSPYKQ